MRNLLCLFSGLLLLLAGLYAPAAEENQIPLAFEPEAWMFLNGPEFPGASGKLSFPAPGTGRLEGDFSGGGDYVQAALRNPVDLPEARALRFEVKTTARRLSFRFRDASGQSHQRSLPLSGSDAGFQAVTFPFQSSGLAWGGANDGKFHAPATSFGVIIRKTGFGGTAGACEFRNFTLLGTSSGATVPVAYRLPRPERNFTVPGSKEPIQIRLLSGPARLSAEQLQYRYRDYSGRETLRGTAAFEEKGRMLTLPAPPETGYYDLDFPRLAIHTAVVVGRVPRGEPDGYFAMDTSLSRKNHIDGETIRSLLEILRRCGIAWGRDRITWNDIEPERGSLDFGARNGRYELFRKIAAEKRIDILDVFHDAPKWNKQLSSGQDDFLFGIDSDEYSYGSNIYPRNLIDAAASWSAVCRHWPQVKALEVWNEPNIAFGNYFPPEFLLAFTRAVSSRFVLDGVKTTVVGGDLADPREDAGYYRALIEGGLLESCDVFSFHTYRSVDVQERQVAVLRGVERKVAPHRLGFPYWITESGKPWPRGTERPAVDDDRASASEIVGKAIEFRALGIAKYFSFCYPYYDERKNNFGMMDNHFAPMRSMAAYGNCAKLLAHKSYIGDLAVPGATRCRVFSDGKESIGCIYVPLTPGKPTPPLSLPAGIAAERITGIDGRPLSGNGGAIPLGDGVVYLHFTGKPSSGILKTNTAAMELSRLARSYIPRPRPAERVVIQPDYSLARMPYGKKGTWLVPGSPFEVELFWNNLSDRAVTVEPRLALPRGVRAEAFGEAPFEIPAGNRREFRFRLTADEGLSAGTFSPVIVSDKRGNAAPMRMGVSLLPRGLAESGRETEISDWTGWENGSARADIKARFRADYTARTLKLRITVEDPRHSCGYPAAAAWRGDSVQIGLWSGGRFSSEFCAAASQDGEKVFRHLPVGKTGVADRVKFHFSREGTQSVYDLEFPAEEFGASELRRGQQLSLTILVNDSSGRGRNGFLHWGTGIADGKNPHLFNHLLLK